MKTKAKRCRHYKAFPTIHRSSGGFLWCPDCGAFRLIQIVEGNTYDFASNRWIYPRGIEDVCKQLEKEERLWLVGEEKEQ